MSEVSRRSFLHGSAVAAATTIPVAVVGCIANPARAAAADAELIRLGAEFDRVYPSWLAAWREWQRHEDLWERTLHERGMTGARRSTEACLAVFDEIGGRAASDANDALVKRLDDIANAIRAIQPTTLAGLAVWAKAARNDCVPPRDAERAAEERDWDVKCLIGFLDQVEGLAAGNAVGT